MIYNDRESSYSSDCMSRYTCTYLHMYIHTYSRYVQTVQMCSSQLDGSSNNPISCECPNLLMLSQVHIKYVCTVSQPIHTYIRMYICILYTAWGVCTYMTKPLMSVFKSAYMDGVKLLITKLHRLRHQCPPWGTQSPLHSPLASQWLHVSRPRFSSHSVLQATASCLCRASAGPRSICSSW